MQLQRGHHFQSKFYSSNILYTKSCRGSRICFSNRNNWSEPSHTRGTTNKGKFLILYPAVFDSIRRSISSTPFVWNCEPTVGRISVKFDTFSGRFSVHRPILNSGTRLSGVNVCQQKMWKGKYLDQIEELLGQLFGVHLERGKKVNYIYWCVLLIDKTVLIVLINADPLVFLDWLQDLPRCSILPPAIPDWSRLPRTLSGVLFSGRPLFSCGMDVSLFDFFFLKPWIQVDLSNQCLLLVNCLARDSFTLFF